MRSSSIPSCVSVRLPAAGQCTDLQDTVGAFTLVTGVVELDGDLEEVSCVTVGVKNVNVPALVRPAPAVACAVPRAGVVALGCR